MNWYIFIFEQQSDTDEHIHRTQDRKPEFLSPLHWSGLINHNTRIISGLPYDNRSCNWKIKKLCQMYSTYYILFSLICTGNWFSKYLHGFILKCTMYCEIYSTGTDWTIYTILNNSITKHCPDQCSRSGPFLLNLDPDPIRIKKCYFDPKNICYGFSYLILPFDDTQN